MTTEPYESNARRKTNLFGRTELGLAAAQRQLTAEEQTALVEYQAEANGGAAYRVNEWPEGQVSE